MKGRDACYHHGGPSRRGAAHPNFRHGARSKFVAFIPESLRRTHGAFLADPEARELREERAVTSVLLAEQLQRIGDGADQAAAGAALLDAQAIFADFLAAREVGDGFNNDRVRVLLARLESALEIGVTGERRRQAAVAAEDEVRKTVDLRRKLGESESRIGLRLRVQVSLEQLQALTFRFADLAAGAITAMERKMVARGIPADEAADIGRAALGEFAAELQQLVPPPEKVN